MTVSIVLGHNFDGYLESSSGSYSSALSGSNVQAPDNSAPLMYYGQSLASGTRYVWQSFVRLDWATDGTATPVGAYLRLQAGSTAGAGTARDMELRSYDFGSLINAADWRTPSQLSAAALRARIVGAHQAGGQLMRAGLDLAELDASASLRYVVCSSRNRGQQAPGGLEWQTLRQAELVNSAAQRPALYVTATTKHLLDLSLGAQVQLSDGTHMVLEQTAPAPGPLSFLVRHHDGTAPTTIDTLSSVAERRGAQTVAMARDEADTVYVCNDNGDNQIIIRAYTRGPGNTWSAATTNRTAALPTYDRRVNNVTMAWHPQGGTRGTLVALVGREAGDNAGTPLGYALISCDHVLTGTGSLLRGSGNADGTMVDASSADGFNNYPNETGTLADLCAVRDADGNVSNRGFITSTAKHQALGARAAQSFARYQLADDGASIGTVRTLDTAAEYATKDADAKARVLPVSASQCVTVHASSSAGFGITVTHRQQGTGGSTWSVLARASLDGLGMATMPAPTTLAGSSAWDALYDPVTHLVWVYYLDATNPRRLMKTHVNLATGLAAGDEVEVATDIGASGSVNRAIRVHRGESAGQQVLISVANQQGFAEQLLYVAEEINQAPDAPQVTAKANFDATAATTFAWSFRDPNPADTQSAYTLEVWDDLTDTVVYSTGQTTATSSSHTLPANTLANGQTYRWRVRTWDRLGEAGPFSGFGFFATSASGNTTITVPATDLEPLETADVQVVWEVTGAVQDSYRVVAIATATGAVHSDTGWIASTATTHLVTGLASQVEYRIEVTGRAAGVASSTGTRLVRPDYSSPMQPTIALVPVPDGAHLRIEVDNPEPGELLSQLDGGFETGTDGWVPDASVTLTSSTEQAHAGAHSGRLEVAGAPAATGIRCGPVWRVEVAEFRRYTLALWAYSPTAATVRPVLDFYGTDGALLASASTDVPVEAGEWTLVEHTASAPAGATTAGYGPDLAAPTDGQVLFVDGVEVRTASDVPAPTANEVWRTYRGGRPELVGTVAPGEALRDYLAGSGRVYTYLARALAPDGVTVDSAPAPGRVDFLGVWLHDPAAPEDTITQYLYGRAQRSDSSAVEQAHHQFVGRALPVAAWGDTRIDTWSITVDIPEGPGRLPATDSLRSWNEARRTLVCRDNRGRVWISTMDGFDVGDTEWGDQPSWTMTRVSSDLPGGER